MAYKYFLYSVEQMKFMKDMQKRMGKRYQVGVVFHKGKKLSFTELSSSANSRYSDAKVVAEGEATTMKYTLPSS